MLTSAARETLRRRRGGDHRRDPRAGAHQARGRTWPSPSSGSRRVVRAAAPAHRAVGHPAPARRDRPLPRRLRAPTGDGRRRPRPVTIVDAGMRKPLEIEVVVPGRRHGRAGRDHRRADRRPGRRPRPAPLSIWPAIHPRLLELVEQHRSTLIFVNARRLAERLATRLNELAARRARTGRPRPRAGRPSRAVELVKAHHGSLSRERRLQIEDELKRGDLKGLVATSSLELGIDMGAVDLVIQVESPGAVSPGPPAHRSGRPPGRRAEPGQALPQAPRRPRRGGRRRRSACTTG